MRTLPNSTNRKVSDAEVAPWSWRFFGAAVGILVGLMFSWSLASPLGSSPDEPAHFIRAAAVVRGEVVGKLQSGIPYATVVVPNYVSHTRELPCYAGNIKLSAGCSTSLTYGIERSVTTATSAGSNSPTYYAIVGLPTLILSGDLALYAMRFVSLLLCSGLLAATLTVFRVLRLGNWASAGAIVGITPMALFLGGSLNPNTMEMAASALVFATVLLLARHGAVLSGKEFVLYGSLAVAGVTLLTGTRSISLLWLLSAVVAALLLTQGSLLVLVLRRPRTWIVIAAIGLVAVLGLIWFIAPLPAGPATGGPPNDGVSRARVAATMIKDTFGYWNGWIGYFGWLDQPSPDFVYVVWHLFIGVVLAGGIFAGRGRPRIVAASLALVSFAIPVIVQSAIYSSQGWIWQGRYLLAIDLLLLITAGISIDKATEGTPQLRNAPMVIRAFRAGLILMAVAQLLAFFQTLARYVVGSAPVWSVLRGAEWQPPLTWAGVTVLYTAILGFGVIAIWQALDRQTKPALTS